MIRPDFRTIRKMYVSARIDTIPTNVLQSSGMNWRQAGKNIAHAEFNDFINDIRDKAIQDYLASDASRQVRHDNWDDGFTAGMAEWRKQKEDPTYPIYRINPHRLIPKLPPPPDIDPAAAALEGARKRAR